MRTRLSFPFISLVTIVIVWCVVLPFIWASNWSQFLKISYWETLSYYIPELVVGALVLVCLPMVLLRHHFAVIVLVCAAVLAPVLTFTIGSLSGLWPLSVLLLLLLSWRLHVLITRHA